MNARQIQIQPKMDIIEEKPTTFKKNATENAISLTQFKRNPAGAGDGDDSLDRTHLDVKEAIQDAYQGEATAYNTIDVNKAAAERSSRLGRLNQSHINKSL